MFGRRFGRGTRRRMSSPSGGSPMRTRRPTSTTRRSTSRPTPPRATPQKPVRSVDPVRKMPTRSKPPRATPQTPKRSVDPIRKMTGRRTPPKAAVQKPVRSVDPIRKPTIGKPVTRKPKFTGHSGSGPRGGLPALKKPTRGRRR